MLNLHSLDVCWAVTMEDSIQTASVRSDGNLTHIHSVQYRLLIMLPYYLDFEIILAFMRVCVIVRNPLFIRQRVTGQRLPSQFAVVALHRPY